MNASTGRPLLRRAGLGIGIAAGLTLCACGGTPRPRVALSPIIPPGPRALTDCLLHHDLTLDGETIDGPTGGIDIQSVATGPPDFLPGSPCIPSMLDNMLGDTVTPISAIRASDVLGCHLPLEDVYVLAGPDHAASLAAATIECQVIGTDSEGHPRWWGGIVSGILADDTAPSPPDTLGPLPAPGRVLCRILLTQTEGDPSQQKPRELVEGTSEKVCRSLSSLTGPESVDSGTPVTSVPGSFQRICDRKDAYVFAPSQDDDDNIGVCGDLAG